jgi:hypothetical protein
VPWLCTEAKSNGLVGHVTRCRVAVAKSGQVVLKIPKENIQLFARGMVSFKTVGG